MCCTTPGQRGDRLRRVDALADEQRRHQMANVELGLGDEIAHRGRAAQPPRPRGGESCRSRLRIVFASAQGSSPRPIPLTDGRTHGTPRPQHDRAGHAGTTGHRGPPGRRLPAAPADALRHGRRRPPRTQQTQLNLQIRQACCLLAAERYDEAAALARVVAQQARAEGYLPELADALGLMVDDHSRANRLRRGRPRPVRGRVHPRPAAQ